MVTQISTKISQ